MKRAARHCRKNCRINCRAKELLPHTSTVVSTRVPPLACTGTVVYHTEPWKRERRVIVSEKVLKEDSNREKHQSIAASPQKGKTQRKRHCNRIFNKLVPVLPAQALMIIEECSSQHQNATSVAGRAHPKLCGTTRVAFSLAFGGAANPMHACMHTNERRLIDWRLRTSLREGLGTCLDLS